MLPLLNKLVTMTPIIHSLIIYIAVRVNSIALENTSKQGGSLNRKQWRRAPINLFSNS